MIKHVWFENLKKIKNVLGDLFLGKLIRHCEKW